MFDPKSRYNGLETAVFVTSDDRMIAYIRRRFLPLVQAALVLSEVHPTEGERLDLLATRTLGDPEVFWRVCDANDAKSPFELLDDPNRAVRVPTPQA